MNTELTTGNYDKAYKYATGIDTILDNYHLIIDRLGATREEIGKNLHSDEPVDVDTITHVEQDLIFDYDVVPALDAAADTAVENGLNMAETIQQMINMAKGVASEYLDFTTAQEQLESGIKKIKRVQNYKEAFDKFAKDMSNFEAEMSYYVDKIGLTEAEYKYLRYKVRIQNVLAVGSDDQKWAIIIDKKNNDKFEIYKNKFENGTGLEFNEENWMNQYNSMSGHGDFAHQMITMATILSESGWAVNLYTGGEEMTDHNSGWYGDVTLNGQLGNDDYCADLDAVNIAAMIEDGQSYIDAMNQYYSEVGTEYTRAEKFVENIPLEKIESMLIEYYYAECEEGTLTVDGLKQISEKAYNFIKNIQENNNTLIKYEE